MAVKPIPEGAHTLTPNLVVSDGAKAVEFYKRALGAQEVTRFPAPDGKSIWHAELKVGDSLFYLNDAMPGMGPPAPTPAATHKKDLTEAEMRKAGEEFARQMAAGQKR
jgi:uncharacterized glyoxalase superfamily protein PhnB